MDVSNQSQLYFYSVLTSFSWFLFSSTITVPFELQFQDARSLQLFNIMLLLRMNIVQPFCTGQLPIAQLNSALPEPDPVTNMLTEFYALRLTLQGSKVNRLDVSG